MSIDNMERKIIPYGIISVPTLIFCFTTNRHCIITGVYRVYMNVEGEMIIIDFSLESREGWGKPLGEFNKIIKSSEYIKPLETQEMIDFLKSPGIVQSVLDKAEENFHKNLVI